MGVVTRMTFLRNGESVIPGFLARPEENKSFPAIILIHDYRGLVDHFKELAQRLASERFVTLAIDLFHRGENYLELYDDRVVADVISAISFLQTTGYVSPDGISVLGFCMGGRYSLLTACRTKVLRSSIVYYGPPKNAPTYSTNSRTPVDPVELVKDLACPILFFYGEADDFIPLSDVTYLRDRLKSLGKNSFLKTYPGANHAFFDAGRQWYKEDAAEDSWNLLVRFLNGETDTLGISVR